MAIYTCPRCNNRFYLDSKDIKSAEFQQEFRCSSCGAGFNDVPINNEENPSFQAVETTNYQQERNIVENNNSTVGTAIKGLSIVLLVLCVIGSLVVIGETLAVGLAMLIISVLFCLLSYGVGEIICLLKEIKSKIK